MKNILIIDDDPDDVQIFCEAVREIDKKIHCYISYSSEEGLQLLQSEMIKPDFIFLDINMPRMNGKLCLMQIKNDLRLADIPVIMYTTSKLKSDTEETMRLGACAFLTKPNKFDELVKALSIILKENFTANFANSFLEI